MHTGIHLVSSAVDLRRMRFRILALRIEKISALFSSQIWACCRGRGGDGCLPAQASPSFEAASDPQGHADSRVITKTVDSDAFKVF